MQVAANSGKRQVNKFFLENTEGPENSYPE